MATATPQNISSPMGQIDWQELMNEAQRSISCSSKKNYILDDVSDDSTITLNGHTMTKKELEDMIDWWKR
jgi:hypothetical protein